MPQRTNPFQQLTASIFATIHYPDFIVEESILEINKKTGLPREIDVRITEKANPKNKILVECRDHQRRQDVTWIDQLDGKAGSLSYSKIIAVSSSGFSKTAIVEAASRGIKTLHLKEAEKLEWKKWLFSLDELGLDIDFEPKIKKIDLEVPYGHALDFKGFKASEKNLINPSSGQSLLLKDLLSRIKKNPAVIRYIRSHNRSNSTESYHLVHTFDKGWGLDINNTFVPVLKMTVTLESRNLLEKIKLNHFLVEDKKILTGKSKLDPDLRLILEERAGELLFAVEQKNLRKKKFGRRKTKSTFR